MNGQTAHGGLLADDVLAEHVRSLWLRFRPLVQARLQAVSEWSSAADGNDSRRPAAHDAAHKLSGVLGCYGLTRGSDLAAELTVLTAHPAAPADRARARAVLDQLHEVIDHER